ncbi:hypothetical protein [Cryptosporangium phraense]|uniref:Uncharacterized protein n=1 Tax=Cryptosporangium phraense TaxID=2593070 RepID=A0A545AGC7_9ACTN|nr:hypothetical protein [Cryptosporangium phraense]TQS40361.1 hypothetical protein FL583_35095 [Cryptosporangium phraense]
MSCSTTSPNFGAAERSPLAVGVPDPGRDAGRRDGRDCLIFTADGDRLLDVTAVNSEFAHYVPPARQVPEVHVRTVGDPDNFPVGVKHRYSR